jgi:hypothetical protein
MFWLVIFSPAFVYFTIVALSELAECRLKRKVLKQSTVAPLRHAQLYSLGALLGVRMRVSLLPLLLIAVISAPSGAEQRNRFTNAKCEWPFSFSFPPGWEVLSPAMWTGS